MLSVPGCGSARHCFCLRSSAPGSCYDACWDRPFSSFLSSPFALTWFPDLPSSASLFCLSYWSVCHLSVCVCLPGCLPALSSISERLSSIQCCSICRCADKGKLVEVRNHDWWGPPALGLLGPPASALQGSIGHQPAQQQSRSGSCCWCRAEGHLVKDCPLNAYLDEHMEDSPKQDAHLAGKKCWSGLQCMRKELTRRMYSVKCGN